MALLRLIIGLIVTAGIATISVLNRDDVVLMITPFGDDLSLPLYSVILLSASFGFVIGCIVVWLNMGGLRSEKRKQAKEIKLLERELETLKQDRFSPKPSVNEFFPAISAR